MFVNCICSRPSSHDEMDFSGVPSSAHHDSAEAAQAGVTATGHPDGGRKPNPCPATGSQQLAFLRFEFLVGDDALLVEFDPLLEFVSGTGLGLLAGVRGRVRLAPVRPW